MALNQYEVGTTVLLETTITDENGTKYNPTTISGMIQTPGGASTYYAVSSTATGEFWFKYLITEEGEYTYTFFSETPISDVTTFDSGFFIGIEYTSSSLDYLIPQLRDHLGDRDAKTYSTDFLRQQLFSAFKALVPRWQYRYSIDALDVITRNPDVTFVFAEPPTIQKFDERPIILMASIIVKRGLLQSSSLGFGSWRDDEISYSNIEGSRVLKESLAMDMEELETILPSRTRKLSKASKQSLPGFINIYED